MRQSEPENADLVDKVMIWLASPLCTHVRKKNYNLFVKNTKKSTCVKVDYTTELQFNNRCRRHILRLQLRV